MNNHDWSRADGLYQEIETKLERFGFDRIEICELKVELGLVLQTLRKQYPNDKSFGEERRRRYPKMDNAEPSRLMQWARVPKEERMKVYERSEAVSTRRLLDEAHKVWTPSKPLSPPARPSVSEGWAKIVSERTSVWAHATIRGEKKAIEKAYGKPIPRRLARNDSVVDDIANIVEKLAKKPSKSPPPLKLTATEKQKVERGIIRELKEMKPQIDAAIEERVEKQVAKIKADYAEKLAALKEERRQLDAEWAGLRKWESRLGLKNGTTRLLLKEADWKSLRQLLHPDRELTQARAERALALINAAVV